MKYVLNGPIGENSFDEFINVQFAKFPSQIGLGVLRLKSTNDLIGFAGVHELIRESKTEVEIGFVINISY